MNISFRPQRAALFVDGSVESLTSVSESCCSCANKENNLLRLTDIKKWIVYNVLDWHDGK